MTKQQIARENAEADASVAQCRGLIERHGGDWWPFEGRAFWGMTYEHASARADRKARRP